jgi:hypothetical protein
LLEFRISANLSTQRPKQGKNINTVRLALEGQDARRSANAIEALEQLLPKKLSRGLVLGLEKNLRGANITMVMCYRIWLPMMTMSSEDLHSR